ADRRQRAHLLLVQQRTALDVARAVQESRLPRLRDGLVRRPGRRVRAQDRGSEPAVAWFGPGIRWQRVVFEARCRYRGAAPNGAWHHAGPPPRPRTAPRPQTD